MEVKGIEISNVYFFRGMYNGGRLRGRYFRWGDLVVQATGKAVNTGSTRE